MIRQLVAEVPGTEQVLDRVSHRLQLTPDETNELAHNLHAPGALQRANVSVHDRAIVTESFRCRWSVTQHSDQVAIPATGCQPGMPLAGLLFNFAFSRLLQMIRQRASEAGIICQVQSSGNRELLGDQLTGTDICDVSFVDDGAFLLAHAIPHVLLQQIAVLCDIIHSVCTSMGFLPNSIKMANLLLCLNSEAKGLPTPRMLFLCSRI